jgi:hypothetical protein
MTSENINIKKQTSDDSGTEMKVSVPELVIWEKT